MVGFLVLFLMFILYIYLFEQKLRHSLESIKEDIGLFNNRFLAITHKISDIFKNRVWFSNLILMLGSVLGVSLIILDVYKHFPARALLTGVGLIALFLSSFMAASISGNTWIKRIYCWTISASDNMVAKVIKGFIFEFIFVYPGLIFILIVLLVLIGLFSNSPSPMNMRMLVYALPVFAVLWVYRLNDYNERYNFQLNIRRLIMYLVVAVTYFVMKDPNSLMIEQTFENKLDIMFLDILVVVFITLDRVGKVIIEILREAKEKTVK